MNFLRKFGLVVCSTLLPISLFSFGLSFSVYQVYGTPDHIKTALEESGIYDTFISDVIENAKQEEGQSQDNTDIPVDQPEVKQIISQAASPEFLQSQAEGFLDGIYAWARGDSKELKLNVDLTDAKARLADGLAQYAVNRAASLPACTAADLSLVQPGDFDVLNAPCVPPGTDVNAAAEKIRQEINGDEFLKDAHITAEDIKNKEGKTLEEQLKEVPGIFDRVVKGIWLSAMLAIVLSAAIVALRRPWRAGLKQVGITYLSVGGTITVLAIAGAFVITAIAEAVAKDGALQNSLAEIIKILVGDFQVWWLGCGIVVLVLGIAMLVSLRFIKAGKEPEEPKELSGSKPEKPTHETHPPKNPHITKTV